MSSVLSIIIGAIIIFLLIRCGVIPYLEILLSLSEFEIDKWKEYGLKLILVVILIVMIGFVITYLSMINLIEFVHAIGG